MSDDHNEREAPFIDHSRSPTALTSRARDARMPSSAVRDDEALASRTPPHVSRVTETRWFVPAVLAAPYLLTVAALRGLTVTLPIFHGSDERTYHLVTIHQFASQLPFPDLVHYSAAQTPLYHLLMAYVGDIIGYQVWRLRLVEVLISYGLAWTVFVLLHRRLAISRLPALTLTLLFALSPYVFGASFRVVTDNLALLFVVVALERLERFRRTQSLGPYLGACTSIGLGILTRQSSAFMLPVAAAYALLGSIGVRRLIIAGIALATAALPSGVLFLLWHGLVPQGGHGDSCGLCSTGSGAGAAKGTLSVQSVELTLAALGVYSLMFVPQAAAALRSRHSGLIRWARSSRAAQPGMAAIAVGLILLLAWPARPGSDTHTAGWIWNVARNLPAIDSSSLVFWILVPVGGLVLATRLELTPRRWLVGSFCGFFLLEALVTRLPWQKYVDPFVLLALLLTVQRQEFSRRWQLLGAGLLIVGSAAYTTALAVTGGT